MPGSTTCRCWPSPGSRPAPRSAATTSRNSTCISMFKDVAGAYVQQATAPAQVRHLIDRAVRIAKGERRVTALIFPNDLQDEPYEEPPRKHGTLHSGVGYTDPKVVPYDADLRRAAEVLNAGKKVAILVGAGALHATDEVIAVANRLGAGVAKALLGKAALPDELPWVTGSIGLLGTKPSWDLMTELRHAADDRLRLPLFRVPAEGRQRPRRADRPQARHARASATRWRSTWSATVPRPCAPCCRCWTRKADRSWRATIEKNVSRPGGRKPRPGRCTAPIRSIRSAWHGNCRRVCRNAPSSPAIPVPAPTGLPATSRSAAA